MVCYLKHKAGTSLPFLVVGVAQLVRAPGCGPGGRGFDSLHSPQFPPFSISIASMLISVSILPDSLFITRHQRVNGNSQMVNN